MKPKLFIAVPTPFYVDTRFVRSLMAHMQHTKHPVQLQMLSQRSSMAPLRNSQISFFLASDCDYYVQLDSDLEVLNDPVGDNLFDRMVAHGKDFVGGLYAKKNPRTKTMISSQLLDKDRKEVAYNSGLIEMEYMAGGCWCVTRESIEEMVGKFPNLHYEGRGGEPEKCFAPFTEFIKVRTFLTEDYAFCSRYRGMGRKIWADTGILLRHWGAYGYTVWPVQEVTQ